ncbi:hypothetical protein FEZ41_13240 [Lentilactobacillus parafarraginis]|jgi:hypothetical protein|uniref:DNA-directed RNA polymerase subunit beta n=2 Tax=Lentilactobacillus parafarraginis TaxID=390842 RepID=A0A0R1Y7K4_9LACO|nr:hypothetical protein [Lentilactobacillus parafarraginis]KRM35590.1 hypothetical protein FD47_GL000795 [Lentilactobacillus parafarraginis DSM 18390 = JCM 14109]TLQ16196.1 hypothetical protein FEZ41_13240 [Lentilactobacillus parafarraginis]
MLLKWISSNYFRLIGSLVVIGVVLFIFGLLLGGFNLDMFNYPGDINMRPWYWFLAFKGI